MEHCSCQPWTLRSNMCKSSLWTVEMHWHPNLQDTPVAAQAPPNRVLCMEGEKSLFIRNWDPSQNTLRLKHATGANFQTFHTLCTNSVPVPPSILRPEYLWLNLSYHINDELLKMRKKMYVVTRIINLERFMLQVTILVNLWLFCKNCLFLPEALWEGI